MKTEESNTIIAEYVKLQHTIDYGLDGSNEFLLVRATRKDDWQIAKYNEKIEWLYPVYLKLRKELKDLEDYLMGTSDPGFNSLTSYNRRSAIEVALIQGDIPELHSEIVKGIQFITENKK